LSSFANAQETFFTSFIAGFRAELLLSYLAVHADYKKDKYSKEHIPSHDRDDPTDYLDTITRSANRIEAEQAISFSSSGLWLSVFDALLIGYGPRADPVLRMIVVPAFRANCVCLVLAAFNF